MLTFTSGDTIEITSIDCGDRTRQEYNNIEQLADSIAEFGLITPIALSLKTDGTYKLEDGGRRMTALKQLGCEKLYFGYSRIIGCPGFALRHEVNERSESKLSELIANLSREDFTWQEELSLIVEAYKLASAESAQRYQRLTYAVFGQMLGGYTHSEINAALSIHKDVINNPDDYKSATSIFSAYGILLRKNSDIVSNELARRIEQKQSLSVNTPNVTQLAPIFTPDIVEHAPISMEHILGKIKRASALDYLQQFPDASFDGIHTDPDYGITVERLNSNAINANSGIYEEDANKSISGVIELFPHFYRVLKNTGYFTFFYDFDHHDKLSQAATDAGFSVQRWPIIWHKPDHGSNANGRRNSTKDYEPMMVCAKNQAQLTLKAPSSVWSIPKGTTVAEYGHPFAKPAALWHRIYQTFQTNSSCLLEPFAGRGSAVIPAISAGLEIYACEIDETHYANLIINVNKAVSGRQ